MKNPKIPQSDLVNHSLAHSGIDINASMNDPMGLASRAAAGLDADILSGGKNRLVDAFTDSDRIDPDSLTNEMAADGQDDFHEGLTPIHHLDIDESRIDELLVEDSLDEDHYPTISDIAISDIADDDAVAQSYEDK